MNINAYKYSQLFDHKYTGLLLLLLTAKPLLLLKNRFMVLVLPYLNRSG